VAIGSPVLGVVIDVSKNACYQDVHQEAKYLQQEGGQAVLIKKVLLSKLHILSAPTGKDLEIN
jgi:hypothetical protein